MERVDTQGHTRDRERNGNVWSGAVAMVLLGLFVIELDSSELDAGQRTQTAGPVAPALIAGQ